MKRKSLFILTLLLFLCCIAGCGAKEQVRPEQEIVQDIIYTFDAKQGNPDTEKLLSELEKANPKKAAVWKNICSVWSDAYSESYVNPSILPDGLPTDNSLAIVVLGFELNPDGSMKDELIGRLQTAYDCAIKYPNAYIVMTGGGTAANNREVTEADSMADWIRSRGISDNRIIVENKSMSTLQNADNSFRILEAQYPSVTKLAIVTSDYHVPWGVVNFDAVIEYEASKKGTAPMYEIISNAGYLLDHPTYPFEVINQYQMDQLWRLELSFR